MSTNSEKRKKRLSAGRIAFAGTLALLLLLTACGSGSSQDSVAEAPAAADSIAAAPASDMDSAKALHNGTVSTTSGASTAAEAGAPVVQTGSAAGIGQIADAGTTRKVIYKANVAMPVPDYDAAEKKLRDIIHLSGSYVLQFSNSMDAGGKGATYVIKVPADGFSSFIDRLREIEKDLQLQMEGSDVTEEYVDLDARLQAKKTAEARLLAFMDKATKSDDLVRFSNELASVQEEIEQIKGRMRYLDQNVAYSTVNVRLYEGTAVRALEKDGQDGFGHRLANALTGSAKALGQFGQALLVFLAALLPVAAVVAIVGVPAFILVRRQRNNRKEAAACKRQEWNAAALAEKPPEDGLKPE
ncbi:DUF4349 domain-containing protein [Cohnella candidum]|uniref:DUF4349 domain-containing protein n=1 Tax=Cohnella candidum TaxID=2674991 RepID=A0A3G3JU83_9BACL|nr:DUF4349 domain-containing protein [Cohnella candidum]AYQ71795.1 DUF4349 domain-containing protein [Cohnella candidum]